MIADLIRTNRSYRRFDAAHAVSLDTLRALVNLARLAPSARNAQPLRFILSNTAVKNAKIFETLTWAGYLKDWPGPTESERPAAYIVLLGDTLLGANFGIDAGLATQSILLGAVERGLGGCTLTSANRPKLREALNIPERYEIVLVIALGKPAESVTIEPLGAEGDIKYWRDAEGGHHVPKRALDDLILEIE